VNEQTINSLSGNRTPVSRELLDMTGGNTNLYTNRDIRCHSVLFYSNVTACRAAGRLIFKVLQLIIPCFPGFVGLVLGLDFAALISNPVKNDFQFLHESDDVYRRLHYAAIRADADEAVSAPVGKESLDIIILLLLLLPKFPHDCQICKKLVLRLAKCFRALGLNSD
jgi:hypothetical protein